MLMRNPEYQVDNTHESRRVASEPLIVGTPREMLLGQIVVILILAIAILPRAMT